MDIVYGLQSIAAPWLDALMTLITDLGSERAYIALIVIVYLGIDARAGQRLGVLLVTSFFVNQYAKGLFDTPRPFLLDPEIVRTERALATAVGPGFPSGHAQGAATFWGYAAMLARRPLFSGVAVAIVLAVSASRLYLGVHLPADVLGGLLIGVALVAVAVAVDRVTWSLPRWALATVAVALPLGLHLTAPTNESDLLAGALSALVLGPLLLQHRAGGGIARRASLALLGLLLVFTVLLASSAFLPEEVKRAPIGGYVRYLVLGLAGTVVAPSLGRVLGLGAGFSRERPPAAPLERA
jgi:membrane-associated phospholipid phosphatase